MPDRITVDTWHKYGYTPPVEKPLPPAQYLPHVDCFGFLDGLGCTVLKKTYCCHQVCHFYKRREGFSRT